MSEIQQIAEELERLLLKYYPSDHRYIKNIQNLIEIQDIHSAKFSNAIGQLGWSGMGAFLDQVFLDIEYWKYPENELLEANQKLKQLMGKLGEHALAFNPNTPNNGAIQSMLEIWGK